MDLDFDIAVIGSGFAGSLMAMIARRLGRRVILIERGKHPRFAIGESSTPLSNLLLEELARKYDLDRLVALSKWGSWQRAYPEIGCGLKRGFTFYHHTVGEPFHPDPEHQRQLLVTASPRDEIGDTHWYRADLDHMLVREAQAKDVEYVDETTLHELSWQREGVLVSGRRQAKPFAVRTRFLIDASGPRGFLHRILKLTEVELAAMPATQGLYTHFSGVRRWDQIHPPDCQPPYPVDEAAMHHVFIGGWIWVLRFNNGLVSAGVASAEALANKLRLVEGAHAWDRLLTLLPSVRDAFSDAQPVLPFIYSPRLGFRSERAAGERWVLLPSAAGFVDPLLSTGFPLTLLGIMRLADILDRHWKGADFAQRLAEYERQTFNELQFTEEIIGALYALMHDFELFSAVSRLYFAAASFSESARRVGRQELAESFLLSAHPVFGNRARSCARRARSHLTVDERKTLIQDIERTIEPVDVIGLGNKNRRNWHPVCPDDTLQAASKLGVAASCVKKSLAAAGFLIQ